MAILVQDKNKKCKTKIKVKRPSWKMVYDNYPKINGDDIQNVDDDNNLKIFREIFALNDYNELVDEQGRDPAKLFNACATRLSLGLIGGNVKIKTAYRITNEKHKFHKKGFVASASDLQKELTEIWGCADYIIEKAHDIGEVAYIINSGITKNGVYIIVGGIIGATGHATLWIGDRINSNGTKGDVIGGKSYVNSIGTIYFWELK